MGEEKQQEAKISFSNKYLQPYKTRRSIFVDNLIGGLAWGLGAFIGLSILIGIVGYIISQIDLIPIIGSWLAQILQDATSKVQTPIIK